MTEESSYLSGSLASAVHMLMSQLSPALLGLSDVCNLLTVPKKWKSMHVRRRGMQFHHTYPQEASNNSKWQSFAEIPGAVIATLLLHFANIGWNQSMGHAKRCLQDHI